MCLHRITEDKPCKRGYKVVRKFGGNYLSLFKGDKPLLLGEWLGEKDYRSMPKLEKLGIVAYGVDDTYIANTYSTGFHVYHLKKDAVSYAGFGRVVVTVQVRKPTATGFENKRKVTVAKEIKLLKVVQ